MARIGEEEIEALKQRVSVERLAEARGVKLRRHGKDLLGLCPFHEDREPSLVITPEKNLWHCLGACQAGGTVIDWVMKAEGVSFGHAVELLRADLPILAAPSTPSAGRRTGAVVRRSTVNKLGGALGRDADDEVLLGQVVDYYHEALKQSPEAMAYLEKRGLKSGELVEQFRLGVSNRTLGYRLPHKNRKAGGELRARLQRLGILRQSGHEHLCGSLVVPVFDESGRVAELYGRKLGEHLREGTPLHLYLPGPHRGVWNVEALKASGEIILCESLIDACTFWVAGYRNVTAAYGVEGFTEDHREAFRRYGVERVLIAYDRDEAGDRGAEKLAKELGAQGIEVLRVLFPKGMDANEYALKVTPREQSPGLVLRRAEWMAGSRRRGGAVRGEPARTKAAESVVEEAPKEEKGRRASVGSGAMASEVEPTAENIEAPTKAAEQSAQTSQPSAQPSQPAMATEPGVLEYQDAGASKRLLTTVTEGNDEVVYQLGDRRWRVRFVGKVPSPSMLRVNVLVSRGEGFHVDTLELYSARQRAMFIKLASEELGVEERVVKRDLGQVLLGLEERVERQQREEREPCSQRPKLSDEEQKAALELLRDPGLLDRIVEDFERCGVVGERTNKLVGYLAATSRKLEQPLAVIVQSSSAAGKSALMEAVLGMVPEEERVEYSAMTGQSLFYMGETDLQHKVLAIVEEQGAERASYALKLLQSEGELTIASTGKDPATGRLVTQEYRVVGPVMIFLTTTAVDIDEELLNRCLVLTVDEGREQTRAIHERQRLSRTLEGVVARQERGRILKLHQDAQRLLRPLFVVNPYAAELGFPDHQTRTRRDHTKYLALIEAVTLLHQYQRPVRQVEHGGQRLRGQPAGARGAGAEPG
jgi:DNA primase